MRIKILLSSAIIISAMLAFGAQAKITFPIPELGNCEDKESCHSYCDLPDNFKACATFAEKNNLSPEVDEKRIDRLSQLLKQGGPGGCTTAESCSAYCGQPSHIEECLSFASRHNILDKDKIEEAKKINRTFTRSDVKRPGNCTSRESCEAFCSKPANRNVCIEFGKKHGLISEEEIKKFEKVKPLIEQGVGPGGCKTFEQCGEYCQKEENRSVCMEFGVRSGFISADEAEKYNRLNTSGPGGCSGHKQCEEFCNNPTNHEVCIKFAEDNGFIENRKAERIKGEVNRYRESVRTSLPPEIWECARLKLGDEDYHKLQVGQADDSSSIKSVIDGCFNAIREYKEKEYRDNKDRIDQQNRERQDRQMRPMPPEEYRKEDFRREEFNSNDRPQYSYQPPVEQSYAPAPTHEFRDYEQMRREPVSKNPAYYFSFIFKILLPYNLSR